MTLLIAEDLMLLLMDDETGRLAVASQARPLFGGALLVELALDGAVELEEKRGFLHTPRVHVRQPGAQALPDPLLSQAWQVVAEKPRTAQELVQRLGKGTREELQRRLVARGILEEREARVLGLFPTRTWPAADVTHERELRSRLHACLVVGLQPDPRTAGLISLLFAVDQAHRVVDRGATSARAVKARAKAISEGSWASQGVRDAVAASTAAVTAALVATTAATSTAGG